MELSIVLWIGGMVFTLGIFAVKVAFGLGLSNIKMKGIILTLSLYLALFIIIALLSDKIIQIIEPIIRKGPYLHALMAIGMIVWGMIILRQKSSCSHATFAIPLVIPCPVCLTAMVFSIWSALSVIKLSSIIVGAGIGFIFVLMSLIMIVYLRANNKEKSDIPLGLSMIGIGIYFILSLYLPAKIEEAKVIYQSFINQSSNINIQQSIGVFAILFLGLVVGFVIKNQGERK